MTTGTTTRTGAVLVSICLTLSLSPISSVLARPAPASVYIDQPYARVAILDKITAQVEQLTLTVGETFVDNRLKLLVERCAETPPEYTPESVAYIHITEMGITDKQTTAQGALFRGWIFSSSPGLSAVEHPVYDVWLLHCDSKAQPVN